MKTLLIILFIFSTSYAETKKAPKAPGWFKKGSSLLDETYPVRAVVVSTMPGHLDKQSAQVPIDFIEGVFRAYGYGHAPDVIIPTFAEDEKEIKEAIYKRLFKAKGMTKDRASRLLKKVKIVDALPYTWQQDYFESVVDRRTGEPLLKAIDTYSRVDDKSKILRQAASSVGGKGNLNVRYGGKLRDWGRDVKNNPDKESTQMGGNIEALPGGLCLVGSNQHQSYTKQFCGHESNIVNIDVDWLTVGHVDEVMKVVPDPRKRGKGRDQCAFKIMAASPKKGLELLKTARFKNDAFFNPYVQRQNQDEIMTSRVEAGSSFIAELCTWLYKKSLRGKDDQKEEKGNKVILNFFFPKAYAYLEGGFDFVEYEKAEKYCKKNLKHFSNTDLLEFMNEFEDIKAYNEAIQKVMNKNKEIVRRKLKERLPECNIEFIEAPNLFYADHGLNKDGSLAASRADAINPNPTNGVYVGNTMMFSDPQSASFRHYLNEQMRPMGNATFYIDTWTYSHIAHGNLHCSSHTIRYCAPSGPKRSNKIPGRKKR